MGNLDLKLPGWAQAGLIAVLLISFGVNGTLLLLDRNNIAKLVEEQKVVTNAVVKVVNTQNRLIDRLCVLIPLDYKQRTDHLRNFPLTIPEDVMR